MQSVKRTACENRFSQVVLLDSRHKKFDMKKIYKNFPLVLSSLPIIHLLSLQPSLSDPMPPSPLLSRFYGGGIGGSTAAKGMAVASGGQGDGLRARWKTGSSGSSRRA